MVASVLDGKACAAAVEEALKGRIQKCLDNGIVPHLAVVIVGDDPASHVYVGAKVEAGEVRLEDLTPEDRQVIIEITNQNKGSIK